MKRIVYLQYQNLGSLPPTLNSVNIFSRHGWAVSMVGVEFVGSEALSLDPSGTVRAICIRANYKAVFRQLTYLLFNARSLMEISRFRPDLVYASDWMTSPAALLLSLLGTRVIYHEHDVPVEPRGWKLLIARTRILLARRAFLCVAPNEGRASLLARDSGRQDVATAWNCPALSEIRAARKMRGDGRFIIHYHGHLSPERLPGTLLHALAMLPDGVILRVTGFESVGTFGYVERFRALAASLSLGHRVEIFVGLSRDALRDKCASADVGFACMPPSSPNANFTTMVGASNKVFDYMACGLPVLVSDLPDWRSTFVDAGYGLACDPTDAASISSALQWFLCHPDEACAMGERGRQRILTEWNYETQFQPILDLITQNTGYSLCMADPSDSK